MKVAVILGPRPEIIKLAPVVHALGNRQIPHVLIDTGQHTRDDMNGSFYRAMKLGVPTRWLSNYAIGSTCRQVREVLEAERPSIVLVQGDTDTTLIGALAATSLRIPVAHVEAGLRCGDLGMREERNRIAVDHMAEYLFAPTPQAALNLRREHVHGSIRQCGHPIADVVLSRASMDCPINQHVLVTLHRAETVDNPSLLEQALRGVDLAADALNLRAIYPVHPRTRDKMDGLEAGRFPNIEFRDPLGFEDFLRLEQSASLILTDSGGIQEEACILGVPCVTLRDNTERPETIEAGANVLAGTDPETIVRCALAMAGKKVPWRHPYGDGHAGERIVSALEREWA